MQLHRRHRRGVVQTLDPEPGRLTDLEVAARKRYLWLKDGVNALGMTVGVPIDDARLIRAAERLWREAMAI
jgi:hypothetical protein